MKLLARTEPRIYCSGLWIVPGNKKRSAEHYRTLLPKTLAYMRGSSLHFFSNNEEMIALARQNAENFNVRVEIERMELEHLPAWPHSEKLAQSCQRMEMNQFPRPARYFAEKGVTHYWRDLTDSGFDVYRSMLAIWLSKVPLGAAVSRTHPDDTICTWVDASFSRIRSSRENHDFSRVRTPVGKLAHYGSNMRFLGQKLPLCAGFLSAHSTTWPLIEAEYDATLHNAALMPYGHDEETILAQCAWRQPDLFSCVGRTLSELGPLPRAANSFKAFSYRLLSTLYQTNRVK